MISKLKAIGLPLTIPLACAGLENNWLSVDDVTTHLNGKELSNFNVDQIGDFYSAAEISKEALLTFLKSTISSQSIVVVKALVTWQYAFLSAVYHSADTIHIKLHELANLWAMFGYPESWKLFIYYLPVTKIKKDGEAAVYEMFVEYYKAQKDLIQA